MTARKWVTVSHDTYNTQTTKFNTRSVCLVF